MRFSCSNRHVINMGSRLAELRQYGAGACMQEEQPHMYAGYRSERAGICQEDTVVKVMIGYLLKNLWEKKGRTLLLLLSVSLVAALFFASSAIGLTFSDIFMNRVRQVIGNADLTVTREAGSAGKSLTVHPALNVDGLEYVIPQSGGVATFKKSWKESKQLAITGISLEDASRMQLFTVNSRMSDTQFDGMKVILAQKFADENGLAVGDTVSLVFQNSPMKFKVFGVCDNGFFTESGLTANAVFPQETIASLSGEKGTATSIWIKVISGASVSDAKTALEKAYPGFKVSEPFDMGAMMSQLDSLTMPFMMMTILVAFMSIFIIYSSFRVIAAERLPVIGTFRSIGATRKMTDVILLGESMLYGVVGGGIGLGLGLIVLRVIAQGMTSSMLSTDFAVSVKYTPGHLIGAFLFALVICFASSIVPILKVSRLPVKDIILNTMEKTKKRGNIRYVLGILLIACAVFLPGSVRGPASLAFSMAGMLSGMIATILLVPLLTRLLVFLLERVFTVVFGNVGGLATKSLRENQNVLNNIVMLAIGISTLLLINTISGNVATEVGNVYSRFHFDIWAEAASMDRVMEQRILAADGIEDAYGLYTSYNVQVGKTGKSITELDGIDRNRYFDYFDYDVPAETKAVLPLLEDGRNIILTTSLAKGFNVGIGDSITLKLNERDRSYKVVGLFDCLMNNGSIALISERYFKLDTGITAYGRFNIRTSKDAADVQKSLETLLERYFPSIITIREMERQNRVANDGMFVLLKSFSVLAMLIGLIGVVNNLLVGFIQRRRFFAMMRSVGMEKKQLRTMIFLEAATGGIVGGLIGSGSGFVLIGACSHVLTDINLPIRLSMDPSQVLLMVAGGMLTMLVASLSPVVKGSKMKLVDALKYE